MSTTVNQRLLDLFKVLLCLAKYTLLVTRLYCGILFEHDVVYHIHKHTH